MRRIRSFLLSALLVYAALVGGLYYFQRDLLYPHGHVAYNAPANANAPEGMREMPVMAKDGTRIMTWYAPATSKYSTFVFFHGNADNLESAAFVAKPYVERGYGFMIVEYRGYSGQPGQPDEATLYSDAHAAIDALKDSGVGESDIVLLGHSLGTGIATEMARTYRVKSLVLLAPFTSAVDAAAQRYSYIPVSRLMKDRYDNAAKIATLGVPVFIAHGDADATIPVEQGKALYAEAKEPKKLLILPGIGHNNLFDGALQPVLDWLDYLQ